MSNGMRHGIAWVAVAVVSMGGFDAPRRSPTPWNPAGNRDRSSPGGEGR